MMETVKMPVGLLAALKTLIEGMPCGALGSTPAGELVNMVQALRASELVNEPAEKAEQK